MEKTKFHARLKKIHSNLKIEIWTYDYIHKMNDDVKNMMSVTNPVIVKEHHFLEHQYDNFAPAHSRVVLF